jgi:hypothetical protein
VNIWANCQDTPSYVCTNASIYRDMYYHPDLVGQGGWNWGINFSNLADLNRQLAAGPPARVCGRWSGTCELPAWSVQRFALQCHGLAGEFFINQAPRPGTLHSASRVGLRADNLHTFAPHLAPIHALLHHDSYLFLMGCLSGQGSDGTALVIGLSQLMYPARVVAFTTVGAAHGGQQGRRSEQGMRGVDQRGCTEPGMRDTANTSPSLYGTSVDYGPIWGDLQRLPWASETSPHAKIAHAGQLIRDPEAAAPTSTPTTPATSATPRP